MPQARQVLDREPGPLTVVGDDAGHAVQQPVEHHHRAQLGDAAQSGVAQPRVAEHEPVDDRRDPFECGPLARPRPPRVGQHQFVARRGGGDLGATDQLGVEGVGDVGDGQPDQPSVGVAGRGDRLCAVASSSATLRTRAVSALTRPGLASARLTVEAATPAACATS